MCGVKETQDVAATSRVYVFGLATLAPLCFALVVFFALQGAVIVAGLLAFLCATFGWGVYKTCYRLEVSDGYLVMRYLYKRRRVPLAQVRRIEFIERDDDTSAKFDVALLDGSDFRVTANASTRRMMDAIVQRQPDVVAIGNIWPPTKTSTVPDEDVSKTHRDVEFWSRRRRSN